ncbi:aromatic ring-hydroxylating oxygenase subunit alpha [Kitasatospora viridis]|uniref:Rieske-type oxygenase n=1 Tax=Kitasatospora viridis TaxID=281105 RepID=A0A561SAF6_9ACTN|nr:Rieske 2Fe-2S domain-containing protein [Kitasatospora viridis]TWF71862.1 Rieske-like 2Fe-2S protein [Kitasatospora viridis]
MKPLRRRAAARPIEARARLPYPDGWFAVAFGKELTPGTVLRRRLMGEEIVVYRTRRGAPLAVRPYCPHLGAHLGVGGKVEGEDLVCPFHSFAFGPDGRCVRTGYGTPPPKAGLTHLAVREINGVVAVWHHHAGSPPDWELPAVPVDRYPAPVTFAQTIVDHPQEVVENAVDLGHVESVHRFSNARVRKPMRLDGARMSIGPAVQRILPVLGAIDVEFDVEAHGLGYIVVEARIPRLRMAALVQMMATPVDPAHVEIRFTTAARLGRAGARDSVAMRASRLLTLALARSFWHDITLDFPIWQNKVYLPRPRLAQGDGPITPFRRWAAQFYPPGAATPPDQVDPSQQPVADPGVLESEEEHSR